MDQAPVTQPVPPQPPVALSASPSRTRWPWIVVGVILFAALSVVGYWYWQSAEFKRFTKEVETTDNSLTAPAAQPAVSTDQTESINQDLEGITIEAGMGQDMSAIDAELNNL